MLELEVTALVLEDDSLAFVTPNSKATAIFFISFKFKGIIIINL